MLARTRRLKPSLGVVAAAAAGLEGIDADDLLARQAGRARRAGINALELEIARRALRHEAILLGGGLQKIGDHRDRRSFARLRAGRQRIDRPRRPGIARRLGEHVIGERDRHMVAALGVAQAALLDHCVPIDLGFGVIGLPGVEILRELGLVVGEDRARNALRAGRRRRQQAGGEGDQGNAHGATFAGVMVRVTRLA